MPTANKTNLKQVLRDECLPTLGRLGAYYSTEAIKTWLDRRKISRPSATLNGYFHEFCRNGLIHDANLHCFEVVTAALPASDQPPAETGARLEWHRQQFKKWSAPGHPLRIALDKLHTLDLVRIIEGHT